MAMWVKVLFFFFFFKDSSLIPGIYVKRLDVVARICKLGIPRAGWEVAAKELEAWGRLVWSRPFSPRTKRP